MSNLNFREGNGAPLQYSCLENPWWRSLVGCSPWSRKESDTTERLHFHFSLSCTGEGNSNPLQCSCLENPRDRRAWWAAVYGVAQSQTQLKRLSSSSRSFIFPCNLYNQPVDFYSKACWDVLNYVCSQPNTLDTEYVGFNIRDFSSSLCTPTECPKVNLIHTLPRVSADPTG